MYLSKTFDKSYWSITHCIGYPSWSSLFMSNINIMAHLGGFIGGLLITLIGYYFKNNRQLFWIFLIILLTIFVAFAN